MRIVTRPDFDGIVCAALIYEAEEISEPVLWSEPGMMQKGLVAIRKGDIIANLPFNENCSLWFDHHFSNAPKKPFDGVFRIAPSAAGLIFEYYRGKFSRDYSELIRQTDKIDSADLSLDEILHPEKNPYVLVYMTLSGSKTAGNHEAYWNSLTQWFRRRDITRIIREPEVVHRTRRVIEQNRLYKDTLTRYTTIQGQVSITDLRSLNPAPEGNRFLVYSLFPDCVVNVKILYADESRNTTVVKVGHSIINPKCNVNVGSLMSRFEGGGHRGAGSCMFDSQKTDSYIPVIVDTLLRNEPLE